MLFIGAWCACQDEALQERIIYGAGLKSNDTNQFYVSSANLIVMY